MKMSVEPNNPITEFVEWVFTLPNYQAVFFLPAVFAIFAAAVIINKIKGV